MKQHHNGNNGGGSGNAGGGASGSVGGATGSGSVSQNHIDQQQQSVASARDCWAPSHGVTGNHYNMSRDIDNQSTTDNEDDSDDMSNKKPIHMLHQLPVHHHMLPAAPGRYSPQDTSPLHHQYKEGLGSSPSSGPNGGNLSHGFIPQQTYRSLHGSPPPPLSQRYPQHELMTSSISAWSEPSIHHIQQNRSLQQSAPSGSHVTYTGGAGYMMTSPEMTSSYSSSWFPPHHSSIDQQQQQHMSSLLS